MGFAVLALCSKPYLSELPQLTSLKFRLLTSQGIA